MYLEKMSIKRKVTKEVMINKIGGVFLKLPPTFIPIFNWWVVY